MYNLTVDEAHTFFVGDGQWLVHNTDPLCGLTEIFNGRKAGLAKAEADTPTGWTRAEGAAGQPSQRAVDNEPLLDAIRNTPGAGSPSDWRKIYVDGFDANGNPVSFHYFTNTKTGQVFDPKFKPGISNPGQGRK
jgi:hypothetical protein